MRNTIHWLSTEDPPDSFPDIELALEEPDGLLAIGGDLSAERLLAAYRRGIFPWYNEDQPILWWSPNPRAVLFPNEFHISRSLRKTLRKGVFSVSIDYDFDKVISLCADCRADSGTWITRDMITAYRQLHELGYAHSIETWHDDELVGGMYGVALGQIFFGESMFSLERDASKAALACLVQMFVARGGALIDCQVASEHLATLGMRSLPRQSFVDYLNRCTDTEPAVAQWKQRPRPTKTLV